MSKETFTKRYRLPYTHDLPSEWNYVEIGKVFKESNENNRPDLPLYSVTRTKGIIPQEENNKRDTSSSDKSKYKVIHPGDIVYNTMRMWQGVVALSNVEGIVSPAYTVCTPTEDVYGKYAEYLFKTHPMIKLFHRFSQGLVDDTLSLKYENFKKIFMPLPPFSEQRKIAAILSSVDEAIEKTEAIIEQTEKVKKGLMQQLLTKGIGHTKFKKTEIGEIPEEWEVKRLSEISLINMGQSPSSAVCNDLGEGIPFFQGNAEFGMKHPIPKRWCTEPTKLANKGDILISVRAPVGELNIANQTCCIGRGLAAITPTKINNDYLYFAMQVYKSSLLKVSQGSTFTAINKQDLHNLLLPVPSLIEQKKISAILLSLDSKFEKEKKKLNQLQFMKTGLMQSLLTGKVRVKVDDEVVSS